LDRAERSQKRAYWGPIDQQEMVVEDLTHPLEAIKNFKPTGETGTVDLLPSPAHIGNSCNHYRNA
jgi:hypothetical protein